MSDPPTPLSMERGGKGKTAIPEEEKADEPSILPMTPESKQLAAVIATAVATAMAGKSASPDSSSSMVRYSAGVSLASRTRSSISRGPRRSVHWSPRASPQGAAQRRSMAGSLKSQQTRQGAEAALEVGAKSPTGNDDQKTGRAGSKIWFDG